MKILLIACVFTSFIVWYENLFVIGFSILDRADQEERCDNSLPYEKCSSNVGCGCIPLSSNNKSSICALLSVACSKLSSCAQDNRTCYQPGYTCVKHSRCQNNPLCYPMSMATQSICPSMSTTTTATIIDDGICDNATWSTTGITVAGGNGAGDDLNQLHYPGGIFLDDDSNLYITDEFNHRVVKWDYGSSVGEVVAGGNGDGHGENQIPFPLQLTVDKNGTIFVCADGDYTIKKWEKNASVGETIVTNVRCGGIHVDNQGSLYYSEPTEQRIVQWPTNQIVAGGNGKGSELNQLNYPYNFFIKNNTSLIIADGANHRVLEWTIGDKQGVVRAGGNGEGSDLNQIYEPMSVILDQSDNLYIADYKNHRVVRWLKGSTSGITIAGNGTEGDGPDQVSGPSQILFDKKGNLWVCDEDNNRIQMFTIDKSACKKK